MSKKLSRNKLIALAEKLLSDKFSTAAERSRILQAFEDGIGDQYLHAAELITDDRHEFKNATELVDFALGLAPTKKLSREELVTVARRLMNAEVSSDVEVSRLARTFAANVPHPDGADLIFWPKIEFATPEELVEYALSYDGPKKGEAGEC